VCYDNDPENAEKYGRYYNWEAAEKACPPGWHLPSFVEWKVLVNFAGGDEIAGYKLKAKNDGTDEYGFSALTGGKCGLDGGFYDVGTVGYWWSASGFAINMSFSYANLWADHGESLLFSVRCVQDCPKETFTDPRDGKVYKTVKIGEQVWMAENLNFECEQSVECAESVCYDNDPKNAEKYGRLYYWPTAMKVCPPGWHLPSKEEWDELVDFTGGKEIAGNELKAKSGWNDYIRMSGNGTDRYGFSALPGGYGSSDGSFGNVGYSGYWWSAKEEMNFLRPSAYLWDMNYGSDSVNWGSDKKSNLFSVRCIQDKA
jgi:uncharacterized protein (TIGR02145 family)